ncbi:MAG: type III pantothenate kinase [Saprospiraceae bacterium]|nr:type III pantothenate kinase [Lewinellaceae bacterium]
MNLCVDIGNTSLKIGLFEGNMLIESASWKEWTIERIIEFGEYAKARNLIFSNVNKIDSFLISELSRHFQTYELTAISPLPFENRYSTPETLGKDRLAAVAGAQALFPGQNCLVIDCGTCIKYDIINAYGTYFGGNIAPGAEMRIKAMHHFTARLPITPIKMPDDFWGDSTETALQNGALRGALLEMEGFIELFEESCSPLQIVLTGGDAEFFLPFLEKYNPERVPDLTLYGLNNILIFNT